MAKNEPNVDAFSLLAKPIRNSLNELGFTVPTLAQKMAIPRIIAGENILLIAPTGTGKTEAVLLPIFSKLIQQKARKSIAVIYITPLRALNRDLLKRLSFWSSRLDIILGRLLMSLGNPACRYSCLLSEEHAQLCAVLLHMAQIVKLKLRKGQLSPCEPAQPVSLFV